jgi:hypothetical protein
MLFASPIPLPLSFPRFPMPLPKDLDRHLTGEFSKGLCASMCYSPQSVLCFCVCPLVALHTQRKRMLRITREPYVCCAGLWPCCGCNKPKSDLCLIGEVCACPGLALAGNRFMVQTRLNKKNTGCDNCLQCFQCCVGLECMIARLCCDCSAEDENLRKSTVCVCTESHCQNDAEIDIMLEKGFLYHSPPTGLIQELPAHFSRLALALEQQRLI